MPERYAIPALERLIDQVDRLRREGVAFGERFPEELGRIPDDYRASAVNLLNYLAVRQHDIRDLQRQLHSRGLSSLGRMEAYVVATLNAVLAALHRLAGRPVPEEVRQPPPVDFERGRQALARHTAELLGPPSGGRTVRVMVTMPEEAADRYELVRDLVANGMDVMRINCSKGDAQTWERMIGHLRRAEKEVGRPAQALLDLAGPNPRTGPIEPGPGVLRWKPQRNELDQVTAPAVVWVSSGGAEPKAADAVLPVPEEFLGQLQVGDRLEVVDTRERRRDLLVRRTEGHGVWAEAFRKAFVVSGAPITAYREGQPVAVSRVGEIRGARAARVIPLSVGEKLVLMRDATPGRPATLDADGKVVEPARIGCTLPEVLRHVRPGQRLFYDDGALEGVFRKVGPDDVEVEITRVNKGGKVRTDKGINLPDTELELPSLTEKDLRDLDFIVEHADIVGLSFIRRHEDVERVVNELDARRRPGSRRLGVILKIETQQAFQHLPRLLLTAMRSPPVGVMVARGDMGVELGFGRLAEAQEEILWLCEAAHVPVVWATQVLESLAKTGLPSRAEVTDAAMSGRAECVMLNQGEHIVETVRFLCEILQRMQDHQEKKQAMLRQLSIARME